MLREERPKLFSSDPPRHKLHKMSRVPTLMDCSVHEKKPLPGRQELQQLHPPQAPSLPSLPLPPSRRTYWVPDTRKARGGSCERSERILPASFHGRVLDIAKKLGKICGRRQCGFRGEWLWVGCTSLRLGFWVSALWCLRYQGSGMVWGDNGWTQKTKQNLGLSWGFNERRRQVLSRRTKEVHQYCHYW